MTTDLRRRHLVSWLIHHTRPLLAPLGVATLARIAAALAGSATIAIGAIALVQAADGTAVAIGPLVLTLAALGSATALLHYVEHFAGHWVAFSALQRLREVVFARLTPQAPAATVGRASAELTERATRDIDRIEVFFAHTIPPVIASMVVPAVALTWAGITIDPRAALTVGLPLTLALLLPFLGARQTWSASRAALAARGRLAVHVADDVQGLREVLAFEAAAARAHDRKIIEADVAAAQSGVSRGIAVRAMIERLLWGTAVVGVLAIGMPVGDTVVMLALLVGLWLADAGTDDFATGLDAALAACERIRRVVDADPVVPDNGIDDLPGTGAVAVAFENVSFQYPGASQPTVRGWDLHIAAGSWHHIVGLSGSGKSTAAALLLRSWDADDGCVRVGGAPVESLRLDALREAVAVVDQRPMLFPGTVADNIRLTRPDATDTEVATAAALAALEDLPLDTLVGEHGTTLSGGQVQRVALARALLGEPRVLVLDEALSQLDADTAGTVRQRLRTMPDRPTIIEITHRVDLLDDADTVTVVDAGAVVERGLVGQLRAAGEALTRLSARA